jgi:hypothetical protein
VDTLEQRRMYARIVVRSHLSEALWQRSRLKVHAVLQPRLDNDPNPRAGAGNAVPAPLVENNTFLFQVTLRSVYVIFRPEKRISLWETFTRHGLRNC